MDVVGLRERAGSGFKMRHRFLDLVGVEEELAQLVVRVSVFGMSGDDGTKNVDRFGLLGLLQIDIAEAHFRVRIVGSELQSSVEFLECFVRMVPAELREARKIVRSGERRIAVERTAERVNGAGVVGHVGPKLPNKKDGVGRKIRLLVFLKNLRRLRKFAKAGE